MVGGEDEHVARAMPIFDALRPEGPREEGFVHAGPVGAGPLREDGAQRHRVRPHAGLRRGLRAAGRHPLITNVTGRSRRGRAARSSAPGCWTCWCWRSRTTRIWSISDYVDDSGEGRWTIEEAIEHAVPLPVITAALFARFVSRQERLAGDEGGRRAAPPVRRARGAPAGPSGTPGQLAGPSSGTGATPSRRDHACTCAVSRSPTSGPAARRADARTRASPCSSAPTGRARRTWSRRSATSRRWVSHRVAGDAPAGAARRRARRGPRDRGAARAGS